MKGVVKGLRKWMIKYMREEDGTYATNEENIITKDERICEDTRMSDPLVYLFCINKVSQ